MRQYLRILARHKIFYSTQINTQQTSLLSLSAYQFIKAPSDPAASLSTPTLQQHYGSALTVRSTPATASTTPYDLPTTLIRSANALTPSNPPRRSTEYTLHLKHVSDPEAPT